MVRAEVDMSSTVAGPWTPRNDADADDFFNLYNQVKGDDNPEENMEAKKGKKKKVRRRKEEVEAENSDIEVARDLGQIDKTADVCSWLESMPTAMVEHGHPLREPATQPDTPDTPDTLPQEKEESGNAHGEIQERGGASDTVKPSKRKPKSWPPALADSDRGRRRQNAVSKSLPVLPALAPKAQKLGLQVEHKHRRVLQHSKSLSSLRPTVSDLNFEGANGTSRGMAQRGASRRALMRHQNDCYEVREKEDERDIRARHCSEWQRRLPSKRDTEEHFDSVVKMTSMSKSLRPFDSPYDHQLKKVHSTDAAHRGGGEGRTLRKQVSRVNLGPGSNGPLSNAMRYNAAAPKDPSETVAFLIGMERAGSMSSLGNLTHDAVPRGDREQEDAIVWDARAQRERKERCKDAGCTENSSGVVCVGGYDVPVPAGVYAPKSMYPYPKAAAPMQEDAHQEHEEGPNVVSPNVVSVPKVTLDLPGAEAAREMHGKGKHRHGFQGSSPIVSPSMPVQRTLSDPKGSKIKGGFKEQQIVMGKGVQLKSAQKKLLLELSTSLIPDDEIDGPGAGESGLKPWSGKKGAEEGGRFMSPGGSFKVWEDIVRQQEKV